MGIISILVSEGNVVFFKSVALTVHFFLSTAILSEAASNEGEKATALIYENMAAWVINEGVHSYSEPNTANVSYSLEWMHTLAIDPSRLKDAPDGWVPIRGTGNTISRYGGGPMPNAWVRRDDVVLGENLKKVIGCWPIKNLKYEPGDYSMHIKFNPDGTGVCSGIVDLAT